MHTMPRQEDQLIGILKKERVPLSIRPRVTMNIARGDAMSKTRNEFDC